MKKITSTLILMLALLFSSQAASPYMTTNNFIGSYPVRFGTVSNGVPTGTNVMFSTNWFYFRDNLGNQMLFTNGQLIVNGAVTGSPTNGVTPATVTNIVLGLAPTNDVNLAQVSNVVNGVAVLLNDTRGAMNSGVMNETNPANVFGGNGIYLSSLSTTNLVGTIPDARLSAGVARQTDLAISNAAVTAALLLATTNTIATAGAANFISTNGSIAATGFGSPQINTLYFWVRTNMLCSESGIIYIQDSSGQWYFKTNGSATVMFTKTAGGPDGSGFTTQAGVAPAGTTFYTNAPLGSNALAAIYAAVVLAGGIPNVTTNDATAAAFIAAANIRDSAAQTRIYNFVNFLKQKGRWNTLNDARFFDAGYQPTNNLSLYGISWGALNPVYSGGGFITTGSNATWGPLRSMITNQIHTEVYVRRLTPYYLNLLCRDAGDTGTYYSKFSFLGGIQNSNTSAGVFLSRASGSTVGTWEHTGSATNWNFDNATSGDHQTTNFWSDFDSAGYPARLKTGYVIIVASTSNNTHEVWINGVHAAAGTTPTNIWQSLLNCTNALDTFQLGTNADYTSLKISGVNNFSAGEAGGYNGNSSGEEILAVGCWNTNANQSFVNDITTAYLMLQPQTRVIESLGASMLNPAETGGDATHPPYTNSLLWIDSQMETNENDLRVETASPGAFFANVYTPTAAVTNVTGTSSYPDYFLRDIVAAGKQLEIWTVGADSDAFANGAATATSMWNGLMQIFQNAGASRIHLLCRPMLTDNGTQNTNLWNYYLAMRTNNLVTGRFIFQIGVISTNFVAANSYGDAHLDKQFGHNMLVQEVRAFRDAGFNFYNPTNPVEPWIYGVTAANDGSGNLSTFFNGNLLPSKDGVVSLGGLDGNTANRLYDVTASHTVSGQFIHASGAYVFGVDVGLTTGIYSTNAAGHGVKMNFEGGILTSTNSL